MDLPILAATAIGVAVVSLPDLQDTAPAKAEGPAALVGQHLYATESPVPGWGMPVRAEDLSLEDMGQVARVIASPEGEADGLVVRVGGIWGYGGEEVELGMERVHLIRARDGGERLVVDLSAEGAVPVEG
jgi:hypothetical protein